MTLQREFYRKSFHLLILIIPMTYHFLGKWESLRIFATATAIFVSVDYLRRRVPFIKKIFTKLFSSLLRDHESSGENLCGVSFVALAACVNFAVFKPEIAITAFLILALSDAAASLVGKGIMSRPFFEKSFAGSAAFFVSSVMILIACGVVFKMAAWFYIFGLFAVFCVTMLEARPSFFGIDDNFLIPIAFSTVVTFFDLAWNYSY